MLLWGTLFHLGIDLTVNIPLFEWIFIGSYVCYIAPQDLARIMDWLKAGIYRLFGPAHIVRYSVYDINQIRFAGVLHRLDIFGRLAIEPYSELNVRKCEGTAFELTSNGKLFCGFQAFRKISLSVPLLWPILPALYLPGFAQISRQLFESYYKIRGNEKLPLRDNAVGVS
jgi:hypothetical protein